MQKISIDTSIIIDYLRRKDKDKTLLFFFAHKNYQLYASVITHAETYAGKSIWEKEDAKKTLEALFSNIKILPLDETLSKNAGEIKARYNSNLFDAIIAATALSSKLELATLNIKDFKKINGLKLFTKK